MGLDSIKINLEIIWIRIRSWIATIIQFGAIGLFLLGVYGVYRVYTIGILEDVTFLGYEVPAVAGFTPMETLMVGSVGMVIGGLALSLKTITGSASPQMT